MELQGARTAKFTKTCNFARIWHRKCKSTDVARVQHNPNLLLMVVLATGLAFDVPNRLTSRYFIR